MRCFLNIGDIDFIDKDVYCLLEFELYDTNRSACSFHNTYTDKMQVKSKLSASKKFLMNVYLKKIHMKQTCPIVPF